MGKSKKSAFERILKMGAEMIPVVFGVFLALALSNFQETQKEKAFIKKALDAVLEENELNKIEIEQLLNKQYRTLDSLSYYKSDSSISVLDIIRKVKGLSTPDLITTSSDFLFNTHLNLVDFEVLKKLSELKVKTKSYELSSQIMISNFHPIIHKSETIHKNTLVFMLTDLIEVEKELLVLYEAFRESAGS
ncbi:MAG: hypothetical protein AAF363_12370 [Bacteroidota bacterium]